MILGIQNTLYSQSSFHECCNEKWTVGNKINLNVFYVNLKKLMPKAMIQKVVGEAGDKNIPIANLNK